jgi:hypothetical protein
VSKARVDVRKIERLTRLGVKPHGDGIRLIVDRQLLELVVLVRRAVGTDRDRLLGAFEECREWRA